MKATYSQIEKALANTFKFGIDGSRELYEVIRGSFYEAVDKAGITKSQLNYTNSDWKAVYKIIKKLIR